jgi:hypothetical protein
MRTIMKRGTMTLPTENEYPGPWRLRNEQVAVVIQEVLKVPENVFLRNQVTKEIVKTSDGKLYAVDQKGTRRRLHGISVTRERDLVVEKRK